MRKQPAGTYNDGLVVMSNSELDYAAEVILAKLGSSNQDVADIIFNTDIGDSVGTFTDNYANGAIGSHPANTSILSDTYTLYQNTSTASESSMVIPAKLDGASGIAPQTSNNLNDSIISRALDKIAAANSSSGEAGTYYITSNTTGTPVASGSWKTVSTVYDEITNDASDDSDKVTYNLYRRTDTTSSSSNNNRPMTIDATTPSHIKEMTNAQLQGLAQRLRNRIIATGIGTYKLQSSTPGTGTWIARGVITDRVPTINSVSYSRGNQYQRSFTAQYERDSIGYAREYNNAPNVYVRSVYGTGNFTPTRYERQFTGQYQRTVIGPAYNPLYTRVSYTRNVIVQNYALSYTSSGLSTAELNALYAAGMSGASDNTVIGTNRYIRGTASTYASNFNRTTSAQFSGQYVRDPGSGTGIPGFPNILNFSRVFTRANFTRITTGPTYFRVTNSYRAELFQRQFTRIFSAQYTRKFNGPQYERGFTREFSGQYTRFFLTAYVRRFSRQYARLRTGPQYGRDLNFTRIVTGPQYSRQYTRIFSSQPQQIYNRTVTGPVYSSEFTRQVGYGTVYHRNSYDARYNRGDLNSDLEAGTVYTGAGPYELYSRGYERGQQFYREALIYAGTGYDFYGRGFAREQFFRPDVTFSTSPGYTQYYSRGPGGLLFFRTSPANTQVYYRNSNFTRIYTGGYDRETPLNYTTGPKYTRAQYTRIYTGTYEQKYNRQFSGQYTRATYTPTYNTNFFRATFETQYIRGTQYARLTTGPTYTRGNLYQRKFNRGQYTRATVGPKYNAPNAQVYATVYLGGFVTGYVRQYTGQYNAQYSQQYSRVFNGNYDRLITGPQYASDTDVYARGYSGNYDRLTLGNQYTREFSGNTVRSNEDVSYTETTTTLWLRVA